jgi:DNA-binding GntR family transcriptional regulator
MSARYWGVFGDAPQKKLIYAARSELLPGGIMSTKPAEAEKSVAPTRGFGVQRVYRVLRQEIIELVLEPGQPLDETRLSQRFEMSRTPVREALMRLATEGFVTTLPNRNTIVSTINFGELPVYYDTLTLMYRITTRLAAMHRTDADLEVIRGYETQFNAAVDAADALSMIASNRELHVAIARAGRNKYYVELFARLLDEGRRLLRIYYRTFEDHLPNQYVEQHAAIIAAVVRRDAEEADKLAAEHAAQIIRQIQSLLSADVGAKLDLQPTTAMADSRSRRRRGP